MSKQNRRSGGSFHTLGQRMLSFGRGIMRTYENDTSLQPDTSTNESSRPRGQWRSMTTDNLIWRQEQTASPMPPAAQVSNVDSSGENYESDYANYDDMGQPRRQQAIQRQPQPRPQQPPQPQNPTPAYIQTKDGAFVRASEKQFSDPIQRRLNAIAAAHEAKNAVRDQERDQKKENIQRKVDSGELTTTRRRRGSIDVDYVQTESLLPAEERGKQPDTPIQREEAIDSSNDGDSTGADAPADMPIEEANWFDEVPDDDADIDSIAGFESTDDAVQRMPDDLPQFNTSSLEEGDSSDSLGEFESGYDNFPSQSADPRNTIDRDYDEDDNYPSYSDTVDDSYPSSDGSESPVQRTRDDYYESSQFDNPDDSPPSMDTPDITSTFDAPVQRAEANTYYTDFGDEPAAAETDFTDASSPIPTPADTPHMLQRTETDEPSFNDFDNDNEDSEPDFGDTVDTTFNSGPSVDSTPRNDAPIQRTEIDEPLFTDSSGDADFNFTEMPSVDSTPHNDTPVQRDTIQRTETDDPAITYFEDTDNYAESDYNDTADNTFSGTPSVDSTSRTNTPVQRAADDDELDYDDYNNNTDYSDVSHIDPSSDNDAPVQRYADNDELDYDDYAESNYDNNTFNDVPQIDSTQSNATPAQRYADYDESAYSDFNDDSDFNDYDDNTFNDVPQVDSTSNSDSPVQSNNIQRTEASPPAFEDIADAPSSDNDAPVQRETLDDGNTSQPIPPTESLTIPSSSDTPTHSAVQRQTADQSDFGDGDDYNDYGDQTWAEANDYTPPTDNTPVHRNFIQPDENNNFDFDDNNFSSVPDVTGQTPDAPVQRNSIQRDVNDDFDFDDNNFSNMPDVTGQTLDAPVQRDFIQPDENDNFDFDDNNFNSMPDVTGQTPDAPVQRDFIQPDENDSFDFDDNNFNSMPDVTGQTPDAPVQRDFIQPDENDNFDFDDNNFSSTPDVTGQTPDAPVQRDFDNYTNNDFDDMSDIQGNTGESLSIQPQSVQHSEMDDRTFDIIGDMNTFDIQPPATHHSPVQRTEMDDPQADYNDYADETWAQANDYSPTVDNSPIQRAEFDEAQTDYNDYGNETWAQANNYSPATDNSPVERTEFDEAQAGYNDYADETWAQANDYSPATDNTESTESPIQRDIDDTASQLPSFDDNFTHLEDTDGLTAMNILGNYLSNQPTSESNDGNSAVQRDYADESYDYLPENFDPTPTIYNFNDVVDADTPTIDSTPTNNPPVQREFDGNLIESDEPVEQPIDLFQAFSQLGRVNTPSTSDPTSKPSIQREYQDDADYDNFGDQTWAEFHDYSPATDHTNNGDTPIQRSADGDFTESDQPVEQPIDLFQALSQMGKVSNTSHDAPLQRSAEDADDDNREMMDLYQAMMQSGMIQDSAQTGNSSSDSEPIQRTSQTDQPSMAETLMRASQVSESSSTNYNNGSNGNQSTDNTTNVISRGVVQREDDIPVVPTEYASTPEINGQEESDDSSNEDKEYLAQLARDVFRVIKRRLREEKERRG